MDENMKARPARGLVRRNDAPKGKDTIPAYLSNGEYVLPKATVDAMGGPEALDKLVSTTNGKAPGGQPVERSTAPFKGGLHRRDPQPAPKQPGFGLRRPVKPEPPRLGLHRRAPETPAPAPKLGLRGFNNGGMTSPMADAQADHQRWLEAGGVTGENVDPSVYGYANGGAATTEKRARGFGLRRPVKPEPPRLGLHRRAPETPTPAPKLGLRGFNNGGAVEDESKPTAGLGTPGYKPSTAAPAPDAPATTTPSAAPSVGGQHRPQPTQMSQGNAPAQGSGLRRPTPPAAAASPAASQSGGGYGLSGLQAQMQSRNTAASAAPRLGLHRPPSAAAGTPPASGSYADQREYARQTGALNIPPPAPAVKPAPLPASNTLATGSAAWSRSLAAERAAAAANQTPTVGGLKRPAAPAPAPRLGLHRPPPAAPAPGLGLLRAADRAAPVITSRAVEGAPGVRRYDQPGQSPLYSNVADPFDGMKGGGTVSTIPAQNMQRPLASTSREVSGALRSAAASGDFRAVRQHYQKGGGTFNGETAEQTALRRMTEPSGSVKIGSQEKIDAGRNQVAIDRLTRAIADAVRTGNHRGAKVLQDAQESMIRASAAGQRNEIDRQTQADATRAGRVSDLRTAVQQQEQAPAARTDLQIKQAALDEQERKNALMARITGPDRDDAVKALDLYRQLFGSGEKQQPVQMSYVGTKTPDGLEERTPVAYDPNSGTWQRMPGGGATGQFIEGKVYVDANGNRATYKNGAWVPA